MQSHGFIEEEVEKFGQTMSDFVFSMRREMPSQVERGQKRKRGAQGREAILSPAAREKKLRREAQEEETKRKEGEEKREVEQLTLPELAIIAIGTVMPRPYHLFCNTL